MHLIVDLGLLDKLKYTTYLTYYPTFEGRLEIDFSLFLFADNSFFYYSSKVHRLFVSPHSNPNFKEGKGFEPLYPVFQGQTSFQD
ncbi:hypothetical protein PI27_gp013 [Listeria phage WIL-1]|uniref:hypothetical protein n=1 Tax=Listeria phage WIL-1 TaxID=1541821 RepID=UPI00248BC328|nr:hypothetical protein PI27_gp013 [Listeria phage WIL-1]